MEIFDCKKKWKYLVLDWWL